MAFSPCNDVNDVDLQWVVYRRFVPWNCLCSTVKCFALLLLCFIGLSAFVQRLLFVNVDSQQFPPRNCGLCLLLLPYRPGFFNVSTCSFGGLCTRNMPYVCSNKQALCSAFISFGAISRAFGFCCCLSLTALPLEDPFIGATGWMLLLCNIVETEFLERRSVDLPILPLERG